MCSEALEQLSEIYSQNKQSVSMQFVHAVMVADCSSFADYTAAHYESRPMES